MKLHPFDEVCQEAERYANQGHSVFQQFNCAHCGAKQTIDEANRFHTHGKCEKCGQITDIKKDGCNYMLLASFK